MSSKRTSSANRGSFSKDAFAESFKRQGGEVVHQAESAVSSGAWMYPIRGIFYLVSRPKLLQPLLPTLGTALLVSVGVLVGMFFVTYLPQVAVLAFVSGPLGESTLVRLGLECRSDTVFQPSSALSHSSSENPMSFSCFSPRPSSSGPQRPTCSTP